MCGWALSSIPVEGPVWRNENPPGPQLLSAARRRRCRRRAGVEIAHAEGSRRRAICREQRLDPGLVAEGGDGGARDLQPFSQSGSREEVARVSARHCARTQLLSQTLAIYFRRVPRGEYRLRDDVA